MSCIEKKFAELQKGEAALIPFVTAGDPNLATTLKILRALEKGGADCIELGIPFSDPTADGPTIQRSSERALKTGCHCREFCSSSASFVVRQKSPSSFSVISIRFFTTAWKTFVVRRPVPAPMGYSASIYPLRRVQSSSAGPMPKDSISFSPIAHQRPGSRAACGWKGSRIYLLRFRDRCDRSAPSTR